MSHKISPSESPDSAPKRGLTDEAFRELRSGQQQHWRNAAFGIARRKVRQGLDDELIFEFIRLAADQPGHLRSIHDEWIRKTIADARTKQSPEHGRHDSVSFERQYAIAGSLIDKKLPIDWVALETVVRTSTVRAEELPKLSPFPVTGITSIEFLSLVYASDALICVGSTKYTPSTETITELGSLVDQRYFVASPMSKRVGKNEKGEVSVRCRDSSGIQSILPVEFDFDKSKNTPAGNFAKRMSELGICPKDCCARLIFHIRDHGYELVAITDSGRISLHALFINPSQELADRVLALGADPALLRPEQWSRLPGGVRENGVKQSLLWFSPPKALVPPAPTPEIVGAPHDQQPLNTYVSSAPTSTDTHAASQGVNTEANGSGSGETNTPQEEFWTKHRPLVRVVGDELIAKARRLAELLVGWFSFDIAKRIAMRQWRDGKARGIEVGEAHEHVLVFAEHFHALVARFPDWLNTSERRAYEALKGRTLLNTHSHREAYRVIWHIHDAAVAAYRRRISNRLFPRDMVPFGIGQEQLGLRLGLRGRSGGYEAAGRLLRNFRRLGLLEIAKGHQRPSGNKQGMCTRYYWLAGTLLSE